MNAKRFQNCPIYIVKNTYSALCHRPSLGEPLQECSISSDITPSVACTGVSTSSHTPHLTTAATTYFNMYKCYTPANAHSQITSIVSNTVVMSLLQVVERYLGGVDTWSSNTITYLFAETPSPRVDEELTEFFAGNGVPKTSYMARVIQRRQQNSCGCYSTRGFLCGTLQTPSDLTPCIMTYVSRNTYV